MKKKHKKYRVLHLLNFGINSKKFPCYNKI